MCVWQSRVIRALDGDTEAFEVDHEMREMEKGLQRLIQQGRDTIAGLFKDDFGAKDPVSTERVACHSEAYPTPDC